MCVCVGGEPGLMWLSGVCRPQWTWAGERAREGIRDDPRGGVTSKRADDLETERAYPVCVSSSSNSGLCGTWLRQLCALVTVHTCVATASILSLYGPLDFYFWSWCNKCVKCVCVWGRVRVCVWSSRSFLVSIVSWWAHKHDDKIHNSWNKDPPPIPPARFKKKKKKSSEWYQSMVTISRLIMRQKRRVPNRGGWWWWWGLSCPRAHAQQNIWLASLCVRSRGRRNLDTLHIPLLEEIITRTVFVGKHMTLPLPVWTEGGRTQRGTQRQDDTAPHGTARHGTGRGRAEHRAASEAADPCGDIWSWRRTLVLLW